MVDARVSGARAARRAGSSPVLGTNKERELTAMSAPSLAFMGLIGLMGFIGLIGW